MTLRTAATSVSLCASLSLSLLACGQSTPPDPRAELRELRSASQALAEEQTYLVLYKQSAVPSQAAKEISAAGGKLVASFAAIGVAVAHSGSATFSKKLARSSSVESVASTSGAGVSALPSSMPNASQSARPARVSSEPLAPMQWNMTQIHAAEARAITPGKKSVVVGVFDSGIDDSLPDLRGQVDRARSVTCIGGVADRDPALWSYDEIGHGSHVAGIIGAKQNGVGVAGVAPGVTLAAVNLTDDGFVFPEAFICGMYWAATHDFDLANASLIIDPWYYNCPTDPAQRTISEATQRAISFAASKGVTLFAAAGNEQQDLAHKTVDPFSPTDGETLERPVNNRCKLLPVELDGVVGVSALSADKKLSFYSNYGLGDIDLAAPGGDFHVPASGNESGQILSTIPSYSFYYEIAIEWNGRVGVGCSDGLDPNDPDADPSSCAQTYALLQGTSQAVPHATGVAALVLSRFGSLSRLGLLAKLAQSAEPLACPRGSYQPFPDDMPAATCEGSKLFNGFYGNGKVDALAALR